MIQVVQPDQHVDLRRTVGSAADQVGPQRRRGPHGGRARIGQARRAGRAWPAGACLFELDQPEVLQYKEQVLHAAGARPTCQRQLVEADLTCPWQEKLTQSGFDPQIPSLWLLEGFLFYLSNESVTQVIDGVTNLAASASWMGLDIINSAMLTSTWTRPWVEMQASMGAPWIGTLDAPQEFLARRGWLATLTQAGASDANYGRWRLPVLPVMAPDMPHNWFVIAQKQ